MASYWRRRWAGDDSFGVWGVVAQAPNAGSWGAGANLFLLQSGQTRAWIGTLVSLFWVELPLTGAVFGALCAVLVQGRRRRVLRSACVLVSLGVAGLTWQWAQGQSSNWPALDALIAAPTMLWALGLLFFSLVARGRSAVFGAKDNCGSIYRD